MSRTTRRLVIGGTLALVGMMSLGAVVASASGLCATGFPMMRSWMRGGFPGMMFMPFLWAFGVGLVIWLVYKAGHRGDVPGPRTTVQQSDSAMAILRKRYAMGEINKEEFLEKKKDLVFLFPAVARRKSEF